MNIWTALYVIPIYNTQYRQNIHVICPMPVSLQDKSILKILNITGQPTILKVYIVNGWVQYDTLQ